MMASEEVEPNRSNQLTLLSLPPELLREIITRATPSDSLCLALGICSLKLYQIHFSVHGPVSLFAGSQWKKPSKVHNARRRASRRGNPLPPSSNDRFGENMAPMREYGRGWGRELHDRLEEWLGVRGLRVVMSEAGNGERGRGVLVSEEEWERRERVYLQKMGVIDGEKAVNEGPRPAGLATRTVVRSSQVGRSNQAGRASQTGPSTQAGRGGGIRQWWARFTSSST